MSATMGSGTGEDSHGTRSCFADKSVLGPQRRRLGAKRLLATILLFATMPIPGTLRWLRTSQTGPVAPAC